MRLQSLKSLNRTNLINSKTHSAWQLKKNENNVKMTVNSNRTIYPVKENYFIGVFICNQRRRKKKESFKKYRLIVQLVLWYIILCWVILFQGQFIVLFFVVIIWFQVTIPI